MPLKKRKKTPEINTLKAKLKTPSLRNLIFALRHRETWPKGFRWDFSDCSQCAMGLRYELWGKQAGESAPRKWDYFWSGSYLGEWEGMTAKSLRIPVSDVRCMMGAYFENSYPGILAEDVSPQMVADRLEQYADCRDRKARRLRKLRAKRKLAKAAA